MKIIGIIPRTTCITKLIFWGENWWSKTILKSLSIRPKTNNNFLLFNNESVYVLGDVYPYYEDKLGYEIEGKVYKVTQKGSCIE